MSDSSFEALANIPGHVQSFAASIKDGKVIQVTMSTTTMLPKLLICTSFFFIYLPTCINSRQQKIQKKSNELL